MKLFYNLDTGELLDVNRQLITRWTLRYRDQVALIIAFLRNGDVVDPADVVIVPAAKLAGEFDSDPITPTVTFVKSGSDTGALWTGILTVDSDEIEEQLKANADESDDVTFFTASIQFYFEADGGKSRSAVTPCDITNSIYRGDETFPVVVAGSGLPALDAHIADTTGAHAASAISFTTAADLTSTNVQAAIAEEAGKRAAGVSASIPLAQKGAVNGVAPLGSDSKVAAIYLPSYVDDVEEYANFAALPVTGESGKIYILGTPYTSGGVTSSQFRWSGSAYAAIIASPGSTDAVTEGASNLYFTTARVLSTLLTGLSLVTGTAITSADSILVAAGKLQAQITTLFGRSITCAGLATGGGDLSANRTITVTKSTAAQVIAGTDDATAVTPLGNKAALDARLPSSVFNDSVRLTGLGGAFQDSIGPFGLGKCLLTGFARVDALSGTQTIRGGATGSYVLAVNSGGQIVISKQGGSTVYTSTVTVTANVMFYYETGRSGTGSNLAWLKINGGTAEIFTDATDYTVGITMLGETGSGSNRLTGLVARCVEDNTDYTSAIRLRFFNGLGIRPTEFRRGSNTSVITTTWANYLTTLTSLTGASSTGFTAVNSTGSVCYVIPPTVFPDREYPVIVGQQIRFKVTLTGTVPAGASVIWDAAMGAAVPLVAGVNDVLLAIAIPQPARRPTITIPDGSNFTASAIEVLPEGALSIMDNGSENAGLQLPDVSGNNKWYNLTDGGAIITNPGEFGRISSYRTSSGYLGLGYTPMLPEGYAYERYKVWADGSVQYGAFVGTAEYLASFTPATTEDTALTYVPLVLGRVNVFPSLAVTLNTATWVWTVAYIRRYR